MENILDKINVKDTIDSLRSTVSEKTDQIQKSIADTYAGLKETVGDTAQNTGVAVRKNPWRAVGIAAAVSLVIGVVVGSRLSGKKR